MHKAWRSTEEVPYCFSRSPIKFEGHMDQKIDDLNPILSKITRLVGAIKSLRFALLAVENPVPVSPMMIPLYNLAGPPSSSCLPLSCTPSTMAPYCGQ